MRILALTALLTALACAPAWAETLVVSISSHRVAIQSNFTGTEVVLFGTVERDERTVARSGPLDVAVVVKGPRTDVVARRKESFLGLWLNADKRTFANVPSYLAILSSRPLDDIVEPAQRARLGLGLEHVLGQVSEAQDAAGFREGVLRLKTRAGLWREAGQGVAFINNTLFRATVPLPANVPIGNFDVDVFLLSNGLPLSRTSTALEVVKVGFEDRVAEYARSYSLAYGVGSAVLAVLCGWLASVAFRRD